MIHNMDIAEFLSGQNIAYEKDVLLSKKTWIKTGGVCAYWVTPNSVEQLTKVCRFLYKNEIKFDIVGYISNIFCHSTYNPQVLVSTVRTNNYEIEDDIAICDCGVNVMKLAKDMLKKGYAGFYGLIGLPGTVASAAVNNASCFSCSISSMLISADVLMPDGTIKIFKQKDFGYEKRSSKFKRREIKGIILSLRLKLSKVENIEEEYKKSEYTKENRKIHQEGYANNLGSIYANRKIKHNVRNILSSFVVKAIGIFNISNPTLARKKLLLLLYGYRDLDKYISNKNINTFVWRDKDAEEKFYRYKEFMGKVYDDLAIEIEERI